MCVCVCVCVCMCVCVCACVCCYMGILFAENKMGYTIINYKYKGIQVQHT